MQQSSSPTASFQDRLSRVAQARENTPMASAPETLMSRASIASAEAQKAEAEEKRLLRASGEASVLPDWRENIKYPLSFIKAAALGMLGAFFGKYVAITMLSGSGSMEFDMLGYYMELGIAFAAALMVKEIFRVQGAHLRKAQFIGVIFMVGMVHNFAFWMPNVIGKIYSPEWVERTVQTAEPDSFMFRGDYFVFSQDKKVSKPKVVRR